MRPRPVGLAGVALGAGIALATFASATPGPGGWDNLGHGATATSPAFTGIVNALAHGPAGVLYAGGNFTDAGGDTGADYVARWSNGRWARAADTPLPGAVNALAYANGKLYVGGAFQNVGGDPNADFLVAWDGRTWNAACSGPPLNGVVNALQVVGSTLYVGGAFSHGAGIASANALLACDTGTAAPRSTASGPGLNGAVYALAVDNRGVLYAGGTFVDADGTAAADFVASYSGGRWHALGSGTNANGSAIDGNVRSLATSGTALYVGSDALDIAGIPQADHVAKWNGSAWSALGSNPSGKDGWIPRNATIDSLATSGSRVFAGGSFVDANGDLTADNFAEFDGANWKPVGSNGTGNAALNSDVRAITTLDGKIVAAGVFGDAGGNRLADNLATYPLAGSPGGGGGGGGGGTTTTGGGAAGAPPTGTATGTVLVNGRPFTSGAIPYRSIVDVTNGRLTLRAETGTLTVRGANRIPAVFVLLRGTDRKQTIVELRLTKGNFGACPKRRTSGAGRIAATIVRQVWGDGKGRFRTRGRYSSATVRGTNWLTADRCDGTLTRVVRGVIQVSDFPLRRQVTVRAGSSYLARP